MVDLFLLFIAFATILVGAELFTNGVEWAGQRLDLSEGAVGSVLAAVGTALPETAVPAVAIIMGGGGHASDEIGIGAILGAPFMLATLALGVVGLTVISQRALRSNGERVDAAPAPLRLDIIVFAGAYSLAVAAAFVPVSFSWVRPLVALILIATYALYVRAHLREDRTEGGSPRPLRLHPLDREHYRAAPRRPRSRLIALQVAIGLGAIMAGAILFVQAVQEGAARLGIAPVILALVISPIATELPEATNGFLWVRRQKDTLALGNITGAMVFQACIPTVLGLLLVPAAWAFTFETAVPFASVGLAFASLVTIFWPLLRGRALTARRLLVGGGYYVLFLVLVGLSLAGVV
ncbi:MAG: sodium:calcium antiporter [Candidatus Limnocylindrales bacterium]